MAITIKQTTLAALLRKRAKADALKKEIETTEEAILQALKNGATVQAGVVTAEIKSFERRTVSWKPVFIREIDKRDGDGKGEELANRIHSATQPTVYENLNVKLVG